MGFLSPYTYEMVWRLSLEALTAQELSTQYPCLRWVEYNDNKVLAISNRLRPLVRMGLLENDGGIYRVTDEARRRFTFDSQS